MTVTPLTAEQRAAVDVLVAGGRVQTVQVDEAKARNFLRHADDALVDLPHLTRATTRYDLAYNAAHDVGEALLAAYGYRTNPGTGQHEALARFLVAVFQDSAARASADHVETMRRERNALHYKGRDPSSAAVAAAMTAAGEIFREGRDRVST